MKKLLSIARFIIFLLGVFFAIFSLEATLGDTLINLIPTFMLLFIIILSWISPRIATFFLFVTIILFTYFFTTYDYYLKFLTITITLSVALILFLVYVILEKEKVKE